MSPLTPRAVCEQHEPLTKSLVDIQKLVVANSVKAWVSIFMMGAFLTLLAGAYVTLDRAKLDVTLYQQRANLVDKFLDTSAENNALLIRIDERQNKMIKDLERLQQQVENGLKKPQPSSIGTSAVTGG